MDKNNILPADTYIVVNKSIMNDEDRKILNMLYQPIIGPLPITLYYTLWSDLDKSETIENPPNETIIEWVRANYEENTKIYGDGIRETSIQGTSNKSWNSDHSYFPALNGPFTFRGGNYYYGSNAGLFAFYRTSGGSSYYYGFRAVLSAV